MPVAMDIRVKRLRYRARHRSIREMDILLGAFADASLGALDDGELDDFEELMQVPDHDVLAWLTGQAQVPEDHDTPLFRKLKRFHDRSNPMPV